ncbi:hypothetical protein [Aeromicrobium marinum]|uniref:hypothetical protein n=1 Tax=Aeromicrobium marinum TaxID=219314 RepID=UPI00068114C7|nr:hypothetical protein [Aeromicrobium marinum]
MSLVSFVSAKGSPGVTRTVTGLATVWGDPVVVADLDPAGGDLALRHRGEDGTPLDLDHGVVSLGAALRRGDAADLHDHLQHTEDGHHVLVGVTSPGQVQGLGTSLPHIATTLRSAGEDVLVDGGRFSPGSPVTPVVERSSALVFVVRSEVEALAHLRERLTALAEPLHLGAVDGLPTGVVLVGDPRDGRSAKDVDQLLGSAGLPVSVLGVVAHDPRTVRGLSAGSVRHLHRTSFIRSLHDVAAGVRSLAASRSRAVEGAR